LLRIAAVGEPQIRFAYGTIKETAMYFGEKLKEFDHQNIDDSALRKGAQFAVSACRRFGLVRSI
jgi:hypothetical protein